VRYCRKNSLVITANCAAQRKVARLPLHYDKNTKHSLMARLRFQSNISNFEMVSQFDIRISDLFRAGE
jgi:hypothetical protein